MGCLQMLRLLYVRLTNLSIFILCSRAEMDIVRSNIDVLVSTGLGPRAEEDFLLARDTCVALLKLGKTHKVKYENEFYVFHKERSMIHVS